ncbi:MAG: hypothetical protein PWQ08_201 [Clostridiales bacterium]|jgi:hypothetical protein|nr:hypothetical protein [Clostridiales bacterium]
MKISSAFCEFMQQYVEFLEEAAAGEDEKYASLLSYDAKRVNHAIANQQAVNMRLARMEAQREEEQRSAGLEGLTFAQILDEVQGEEHELLAALFVRFRKAVDDIKYFNAKSVAFAREGLRITHANEQGNSAYEASGHKSKTPYGTSMFETEV